MGFELNDWKIRGLPPSNSSVSALYLTYGVLGSVIFIWLSFWASVRARFSSSHCKLEGQSQFLCSGLNGLAR